MKKTVFKAAALMLALLTFALAASACNHKQNVTSAEPQTVSESETSAQTSNAASGFTLNAASGLRIEANGSAYDLFAGHDVTYLELTKIVTVQPGFTWMVAQDISMQQVIPNKIVTLNEGTNIYYVFCHNADDSVMENYVLNIHRTGSYTVSFEGLDEVQNVTSGALAVLPIGTPQKEGYEFAGWDYNFNLPVLQSLDVKALWTPQTYTVTFNPGQGSVDTATMNVVYGEEAVLPVPEREGYVFADWFYGDERVASGVWQIAASVTLTARWASGSYTLTLDPDGGVLSGATVIEVTYGEELVLPVPEKTGYSFVGWFNGEEQVSDGPFLFTADVDLKAVWSEDSVSLTFVENGGSKNSYIAALTIGSELPVPSRAGFTFGGWFFDEKLTKEATSVPDSSAKLYAWWQEEAKPGEFVYEASGLFYKVTARVDPDSDAVIPAYIGGRKTVDSIPRPNPEAGIKLSADTITVRPGRGGVLTAVFTPRYESDDATLTYSSSKPEVAEIDQKGNIKGLKDGACVITVSNEASGISADCIVIVSSSGQKTPSITFEADELTLTEADTLTLAYVYVSEYPEDDQSITFQSSDEEIATVGENGEVHALSEGTCTVYASDTYGNTSSLKITVVKAEEPTPDPDPDPASGE